MDDNKRFAIEIATAIFSNSDGRNHSVDKNNVDDFLACAEKIYQYCNGKGNTFEVVQSNRK